MKSCTLDKTENLLIGERRTREKDEYESSLKMYRDLKGVIDTAFDDGKLEGKIEMAKLMKSNNEPVEKIIQYTGLTAAMIEKL